MIGSTGWITGTSCERPEACYPTRPADETYAFTVVVRPGHARNTFSLPIARKSHILRGRRPAQNWSKSS